LHILHQRTNSNGTKAIPLFDYRAVPLGVIGRVWRYAYRVKNTPRTAVILDLVNLAGRKAGVYLYRPRVEAGRSQE